MGGARVLKVSHLPTSEGSFQLHYGAVAHSRGVAEETDSLTRTYLNQCSHGLWEGDGDCMMTIDHL